MTHAVPVPNQTQWRSGQVRLSKISLLYTIPPEVTQAQKTETENLIVSWLLVMLGP